MKSRMLFLASMALLAAANAEVINLKCQTQDATGGKKVESWIAIDASQNIMRINGEALPLILTNDAYTSRTKMVAGFVTINRIDRQSGEIVRTTLYQEDRDGSRAIVDKGTCERANPPPTKF
jgi:hypothetical protein